MVEHDAIYKQLFAHPRMVADLIAGFVREPWVASLDFSTLERLPASFIAADRRRRDSDMVWRARLGDDWVYLYVVLEFQASVDADMALRLLVYTGLLLQDLVARGQIPSGGPYPPVLPLVFYTGERRWLASTSLADQRPPLPAELVPYQLSCRYVLLDEGRLPESDLPGPENPVPRHRDSEWLGLGAAGDGCVAPARRTMSTPSPDASCPRPRPPMPNQSSLLWRGTSRPGRTGRPSIGVRRAASGRAESTGPLASSRIR